MKVPAPGERVFLSAEWRDLLMLNYEVDAGLLSPYIPPGTELDFFGGETFVSLVGFRFLRTKLFEVAPIPFHSNFDEVNLRFYVRRQEGPTLRRGVVFIREIVPRRAIANVARFVYGENYMRSPMRHSINQDEACYTAEYEWQFERRWCRLYALATGIPATPLEGSLEQFITEHYWGYSRKRDGVCVEYHVSHDPWRVWTAASAGFEGDGDAVYGSGFGRVLARKPDSAFIADGSAVQVFTGRRIS
jgi:uncharacterized protein YqjF (DUF2071 family)